jgi:hypothetical protein
MSVEEMLGTITNTKEFYIYHVGSTINDFHIQGRPMQIDSIQFIIQTLHEIRINTLTCKIYYICIVDNHAIVLMNVQRFVVNRQHEHVSLLSPIHILKN